MNSKESADLVDNEQLPAESEPIPKNPDSPGTHLDTLGATSHNPDTPDSAIQAHLVDNEQLPAESEPIPKNPDSPGTHPDTPDSAIQAHVNDTRNPLDKEPGVTSKVEEQVVSAAGVNPVLYSTPPPLQVKELKRLVGFSILALIMFPPTGIPALVLAIQTWREFWKGVDTGQLDVARRKCKISERLVIFSVTAGFIMWMGIFTMMEHLHHKMSTLFHIGQALHT